jgi:hypothetical protein
MIGIMKPERTIVRLAVDRSSKAKFDSLCDRLCITQTSAMSRLFEWFCGQEEIIQASVLGSIPASLRADIARIVLERMTDKDFGPNATPTKKTG